MAGADPGRLSLRRFVGVAFAILVEEYQRLGIDLLSAVEKVGALGGGPAEEEPAAEAIDNKASVEQLMSMMAGVKGAPV